MSPSDVITPDVPDPQSFATADEAVVRIAEIYDASVSFLREKFIAVMKGEAPEQRYRAFYPEIIVEIPTHAQIDSRLSFGHFAEPGTYSTTLTRPDLFHNYLAQQLGLIVENHNVPITVRRSNSAIPVHFAMASNMSVDGPPPRLSMHLRDMFDTPDLAQIDDAIVNARQADTPIEPLAPFTAQRVDYSLARLSHYTATEPVHFQNHVLFTNYQFYMDEFVEFAKASIADTGSGYTAFVEPGNVIHTADGCEGKPAERVPQMPTYHLKRADGGGITMVNIGVGPSNAKTATDHIAVLRPHAWIMVGHCAGLRSSQSLGDYVLAHAYVREDHVLDDDLPTWVPIPALAEIQVALETAVAEITNLEGYELKSVMRTGTVATIDNRNWELREVSGPVHRLSQSRAIALDMESATIAANGFRFRVPYGTLLCVSDKPLHGELKLPGMASDFYKKQVAQHLKIGIRAMESIREMPLERVHSRKLRSFDETAFL
jgi:AMP nucleosidase